MPNQSRKGMEEPAPKARNEALLPYRCTLLNAVSTVAFGLLENGAEIYRVEDSTRRMFAAYGRQDADIFAIPGSIIITIYDEDGRPWTKTRRVLRRSNDFDKLTRLNALSRYVCEQKPDCGEILARFEEINARPTYSVGTRLWAAALVSFGFALMFQGGLGDAAAAALIGFCAMYLLQFMERFETNSVFATITASGLIMGLAFLTAFLGLAQSADLVTISVLMNLVPGSLLTYGIRDIIAGDILSGVTRLAEAFLTAASIAIGAGAVLSALPPDFLETAKAAVAVPALAPLPPIGAAILSGCYAFLACFGFALVYNVRGRLLFLAPLGAALSWLVYSNSGPLGGDLFRYFLGAIALSIYAETIARLEKTPVTVVMLISLLPLVPGGGIYYTMEHCIRGESALFLSTGLHTLAIAGALSLGILFVSTLIRLCNQKKTARSSAGEKN